MHQPESCPIDAWTTLCQWWPTQVARDEANTMRARRMHILNPHPMGRLSWIEQVALEVRAIFVMCACCKEEEYYNPLLDGDSSSSES